MSTAAKSLLTIAMASAMLSASVGAASAAVIEPPTATPTATQDGHSEEIQEWEVEQLTLAFEAIAMVPEALQELPINDPAVQEAATQNFMLLNEHAAAQDTATQNAMLLTGIAASSYASSWMCAAGFVKFIAENALPAAKVYRLAREAGGLVQFAKIALYFVRNGRVPAYASQEMAELLYSVSGLHSLVSACT